MISKVVRPCRRQQVPVENRHKQMRLPRKEFSDCILSLSVFDREVFY
ncbi:hypothetical protein V1224_02450 [Lachnospiraceae bacterium JLR.KK008]